MAFIFGGNTGMSYDDIQRKRAMAQSLMAQTSTPRNVGEGLHAIGKALAGRAMERRATRAEDKMRNEFDNQFRQIAPQQSQAILDLYSNPMASDGQKKVLGALLSKGVPGFSRGGVSRRGGIAIVGERGPEVVELPAGAQVDPLQRLLGEGYDPGYEAPLMQGGRYVRPIPLGQNAEDDEYFRQELGDELFQKYQGLPPEGQIEFLNDPANGFVAPQMNNFERNEREQYDPNYSQPMSRFDDAKSYQVADLDAFKLMQLDPKYEAPVDNDANATEARRLQLLRRAMFADAALEDPRLAKAMTRMDNAVAGKLGALGRLYTNDEYELGRLMAEQFASAILRGDSGAQTPEPEVQRYIRQYFPLPAETPEQIAAKKAMRREEIRAMIQSLPSDARPAAEQIQQEIDQLRAQADVPDGFFDGEQPQEAAPSTPESADKDGWQTINGVKIRVKK